MVVTDATLATVNARKLEYLSDSLKILGLDVGTRWNASGALWIGGAQNPEGYLTNRGYTGLITGLDRVEDELKLTFEVDVSPDFTDAAYFEAEKMIGFVRSSAFRREGNED